jgi:ElaB/YqjD/DUF883 family membrane-anchored ribosome-binding protein
MNTKERKGKSPSYGENSDSTEQQGSMLGEKAQALKETAQQWQRKAADTSRKAVEATDDYVKENRWATIGTVALVFVVLGFVLGLNRDRD